jgi:SH3-like domain-containing protein
MMRFYKVWLLIALLLIGGFYWIGLTSTVRMDVAAQQPTVSIPTVTSSPIGKMATVNQDQEQINVRAGPSQDYPIVGVLQQGERVPALGRSVGGDWVEIAYPIVDGGVAWVYSYLVSISGGELPIIVPPPTPTPRVTPTIDPTLAAQFIIVVGPTRLPTFTQPPPLSIPTYSASIDNNSQGGFPMGFIIIGLAVIGLFGFVISIFRGR